MHRNNDKKNRILTLAALAFLFCTRWMIYRLERTEINIPCFAAECTLFLLIYGLCLFCAPLAIQTTVLFLGCVAIVGLYAVSETSYSNDFLLPTTWFSALLFFINQNDEPEHQRNSLLSKMCYGVFLLYPWFAVGAVVYTAITKGSEITVGTVCCMILSVMLSVVYALIMRIPLKNQNKKQKQNKNDSGRRMRSSFRCAVIAVPVSCLHPVLTGNVVAAETLLILWAVNLPLLCLLKQPLFTSFFSRFSQKQ